MEIELPANQIRVPITARKGVTSPSSPPNSRSPRGRPEIVRYRSGHAFLNDGNLFGTFDRNRRGSCGTKPSHASTRRKSTCHRSLCRISSGCLRPWSWWRVSTPIADSVIEHADTLGPQGAHRRSDLDPPRCVGGASPASLAYWSNSARSKTTRTKQRQDMHLIMPPLKCTDNLKAVGKVRLNGAALLQPIWHGREPRTISASDPKEDGRWHEY